MSFIWPIMLLSLLAVPLAVWLYLRLQQRRRQALERYGSLGFVQGAGGNRLGARRHIPPALFLAGLTILLIALARPQTVVSLPRVEGTVILTFDVSGSMAATDLEPTRMEAAKVVAREFVERQPPTVQIGVVAFSDNGLAVQAPTNDQTAILAAINRIRPQRGTSLGQGILASLNTLDANAEDDTRRYSTLTPTPTPTPEPVPPGSDTSTAIVLLTDGENTGPPEPLEAAQLAADRGVRVYTVGIGSAQGIDLEVEGFTVHTQLDEETLQQIAQTTAGTYYNAESQDELRAIYENIELQLVVRPEEAEVTALFAALGLLVLLIGGACSFLWFSRLP
ncbi:MAG: VWA domain-containing protein [Chloroflexi bacterium]|nr:VWA domain-containing protein [Chloroflexota bacterium]